MSDDVVVLSVARFKGEKSKPRSSLLGAEAGGRPLQLWSAGSRRTSEVVSMNRKATHYGTLKIGESEVECVVLEDGARGYLQKHVSKMFGFHEKPRGGQYAAFLAEFSPKSSETEVALEVVRADSTGRLHHKRKHLVPRCFAIIQALSKVGEVALIDEATGYEDDRAPEYLQRLFDLLLRDSAQIWQRRFDHEYYDALLGLWGREYDGHKTNPPQIIGQITDKWVYKICFPDGLCEELKSRKSPSEKMRQWLTDGGQAKLGGQILAVTAIARSAENYTDFDALQRALL